MQTPATVPTLDLIDHFPAFDKAGPYLKNIITENGYQLIADFGGGANPVLDDEFIRKSGIRCFLIDQSASELDKAPPCYDRIIANAASSNDDFHRQIAGRQFDLIFSHMFLEHIDDPVQVHRNIHSALKPGGRCVHIYPSPNNVPLALNRLLPETISRHLLRFAQPTRDLGGLRRKFKAFYRMCGAPAPGLTAQFEAMGYIVLQHTGFIGHAYYERFQPLAMVERGLRKIILKSGLPLTSACLLVLEKPISTAPRGQATS
jgi:SAM-dependent methyltransferase